MGWKYIPNEIEEDLEKSGENLFNYLTANDNNAMITTVKRELVDRLRGRWNLRPYLTWIMPT